jgi:hypothetical protein
MRDQKKLTFCAFAVAATLVAFAAPAFAEEVVVVPPPAPAEPPAARHGAHVVGDNAGLGVGAAGFVSGLVGPQVDYDFGAFDISALFGFDHRDANGGANPPTLTTLDFGVSGWYHLHTGESSDFSVGGGFGFENVSASPGGSNTSTVLEPGVQMRVFVTPNVAIQARLGFSLVFGDATTHQSPHIGIAGQTVNGFGFTYYFR